ncbi:pulmonary surfactant-associated protein B isoform X1 [Neopelma chrysocephalum]|uniref:pulmonary surfactant-associated protein B isoform X1 n=1 Tax=Neopelma chrysocephalum TaxID=114329 RepID=UPI000FCCEC56|nr:pulmonary surfactant-associated protein B isoform X1 [Neopelma chrysocephalum]
MALALPLLLALLGATPGLGAPGGGCGGPPSAWCQSWDTALRCGALERCPLLTQRPPDVDTCALCQQLFAFLHRVSNQSAVQVAVEQVLGALCLPLPVLAAPCQSVVHSLVPRVLRELQHLVPRQICANLKLCPAEPGGAAAVPALGALGTHPQEPPPVPAALPVPLPLCWLCRTFVAQAEAAIPVPRVAAAATGLCRALPLVAVGACQCLAQRYATLLIEGLLGRLGPRLLCRLLFVCQGTADDVDAPPALLEAIVVRLAECVGPEDLKGVAPPALSPPLGPCALGPRYWCSGPEPARRCQALQHCQEHVWL